MVTIGDALPVFTMITGWERFVMQLKPHALTVLQIMAYYLQMHIFLHHNVLPAGHPLEPALTFGEPAELLF